MRLRKKIIRGSGEMHGHIDLATLMEFQAKSPGTRICTCTDFPSDLNESGLTWTGGEHLVSSTPGTNGSVHMHYYPDHANGHVLILSITSTPATQ